MSKVLLALAERSRSGVRLSDLSQGSILDLLGPSFRHGGPGLTGGWRP